MDVRLMENRLREGDPQALAELFQEHRPRLERMARFRMDQRLQTRVGVDDLLQDAWLEANKRIHRFASDGFDSSFVWLRMILQQTLADAHRKHLGAQQRDLRKERSLVPPGADTSASLALHLLGLASSPSVAVQREEMMDLLQQAIAGMDPVDQEILALRHFEELTNSECAAVLGLQQKAASIRYVRALKRLREIVENLSFSGFVSL